MASGTHRAKHENLFGCSKPNSLQNSNNSKHGFAVKTISFYIFRCIFRSAGRAVVRFAVQNKLQDSSQDSLQDTVLQPSCMDLL